MKYRYWILIIGLVTLICTGCHRYSKPIPTSNSSSDQDIGVTARLNHVGGNTFRLVVSYTGKREMKWWATANATLYNSNGKEVLRPRSKAGTSWFRWVEDTSEEENAVVNHFGAYRKDNPLIETLILDKTGLHPGKYRVEPIVSLFEQGRDADPKTRKFNTALETGLKPGKSIGCTITVK